MAIKILSNMPSKPQEMCASNMMINGRDRHQQRMIKNVVGNGFCGILYKWVNYCRGWRPRWFVLQGGVLSYHKIHPRHHDHDHGHHCHKDSNGNSVLLKRQKPDGEIHLKISSIRESRSDDKRFSIFTGTKVLQLRTESREDRFAWVEALQSAKGMFPRISNSELMAPVDDITISTEKLRQRLTAEGIREVAILDCEQVMRYEFVSMQNQLRSLKQKNWVLIERLRQLDVHVMFSRTTLTC